MYLCFHLFPVKILYNTNATILDLNMTGIYNEQINSNSACCFWDEILYFCRSAAGRQQLLLWNYFFVTLKWNFRLRSEDQSADCFALSMAVNVIPCPSVWPGEDQPSLLEQEGSLITSHPAPDSVQVGDEQLIGTRTPSSKSKADLVIVINEKLKSSKWRVWPRCCSCGGGRGGVLLTRLNFCLSLSSLVQVMGSTKLPAAPLQSSPPHQGDNTPSPTPITERPGRAAEPAPLATPPSRRGRRCPATRVSLQTPRWTGPKWKTTSCCPSWPASAPCGP